MPLLARIECCCQLRLWHEGVRVHCGTDPPGETSLDPWPDDPSRDYDTEPVMPFSAT
jgi:hypothetical protein